MTPPSAKGKRGTPGSAGPPRGMSHQSGLEGEEADQLDALGELYFPGITDPAQLDPASRKTWVALRGSHLQALRGAAELTRAAADDIKRRTELEADDLRARREADLEDQAQRRRERDALIERETRERRVRLDQEVRERETRRKLSVLLIPAMVVTVLVTAFLVLGGVLSGVATAFPGAALISLLAALRLSAAERAS